MPTLMGLEDLLPPTAQRIYREAIGTSLCIQRVEYSIFKPIAYALPPPMPSPLEDALHHSLFFLPYAFTAFIQGVAHGFEHETSLAWQGVFTLEELLPHLNTVPRAYHPPLSDARACRTPCCDGLPSKKRMAELRAALQNAYYTLLDAIPSFYRLPPADEAVRMEIAIAFTLSAVDLLALLRTPDAKLLNTFPQQLIGTLRVTLSNLRLTLGNPSHDSPSQKPIQSTPAQHIPPSQRSVSEEDILALFSPSDSAPHAYAAWLSAREAFLLASLPPTLERIGHMYHAFLTRLAHGESLFLPPELVRLGRIHPSRMLFQDYASRLIPLERLVADDLKPLQSLLRESYDTLVRAVTNLHLAARHAPLAAELAHAYEQLSLTTPQLPAPAKTAYEKGVSE